MFLAEYIHIQQAQPGCPSLLTSAVFQRRCLPISANLSIRSREGPQERRSQEALLDPRLEPEPLVDSSTRTGTEKAPQTWQTQLHSCRTPLPQDHRTPAAQATGGHQPHADW